MHLCHHHRARPTRQHRRPASHAPVIFSSLRFEKQDYKVKQSSQQKRLKMGSFFLHCFCIWFLKKAGKGGGPFSSAVKRYIDSNLLIAPPPPLPLWKRSTFRAKPIRPFSFSRKTSSRRISAAAAAVTKAAPLNSQEIKCFEKNCSCSLSITSIFSVPLLLLPDCCKPSALYYYIQSVRPSFKMMKKRNRVQSLMPHPVFLPRATKPAVKAYRQ